jgi:ferredoxin
MPWIKKEECSYCGTCIEACPAGAIAGQYTHAKIFPERCIRCGTCHTVCPNGAIKHDSEKIDAEVKNNIKQTRMNMAQCAHYLGGKEEGKKCLQRTIRHFQLQKKTNERTIVQLKTLV